MSRKKLVPIECTLVSDTLTPISIFAALRDRGASFLLESVENGANWGRYSIIMLESEGSIVLRDGRLSVSGRLRGSVSDPRPIEAVRQALAVFEPCPAGGLPPFAGGLAGYFGYDCLRYYERLPHTPPDPVGFPDVHLCLFTHVLVYDHLGSAVRYIRLVDREELGELGESAVRGRMEALLRGLERTPPPGRSAIGVAAYTAAESMDRAAYEDAVRRILHHIREGDVFQTVPSRRVTLRPAPDPFQIYRRLRSVNPSPYMYFMDFGGYQIVGSSPECLTRLTGDLIENFPIAGTRRRGADAAEDARLAAELSADEKERAEHAMLVDLGRNDVGKVSRFGTVCVHDLMKVEYFSHVMHLVSRVQGRLAPGMDGPGALMACLPAGTVSGAPKLRAMQLIDELEPVKRGPYAGAVGYFDFRGGIDTCIAIRTLLFKDGAVHAQAGGGIVADSVPALEFEETQNKLRALMRALGADEIPVTYTEPVCGEAARP